MSITNGYCTLAEYKAFLTSRAQTFATDTADDAVLEVIIEAVSRFIDAETCRKFYKNGVDEVRYFTSENQQVKVGDLVSVTTLYTDEGLRTYPTLWAATDFDLTPDNAVLDGRPYFSIVLSPNYTQSFPDGVRKGVKVTGVFGWPSVPTQIKEACLLIAASVNKRRFGENLSSVSTITAGGVVVTPQDVPSIAWTLINPFRKRV